MICFCSKLCWFQWSLQPSHLVGVSSSLYEESKIKTEVKNIVQGDYGKKVM